MIGLSGKRFLVTGAASGIGDATVHLLDLLDAQVVGVDVAHQDLRETGRVPDLLAPPPVGRGPFDGLVHCAGVPCIAPLRLLKPETYADAFLVNTEAALALARGFDRYCADQGVIVFVSSVMGIVGAHGGAAYAMTKAALHGLARSLALELAPKKIRVNCVAPGFVNTPMNSKVSANWSNEQRHHVENLHPLGIGEPEDVANAIAFLLSDAARWITGTVLVVDGGYTAR